MKTRCLLVFLISMALATFAAAQTKISGTIQCSKPDPVHSIDVGDQSSHALSVSKVQCTWSKPIEMAGSQGKDGTSVASDEMSGNKSTGRGVHYGTMTSGDKYFVRYQGSTTLKDGALQSAQGTWSFTGGTGKLKGLKGKGTYKGTGNPDGTATYAIEGDYQVP